MHYEEKYYLLVDHFDGSAGCLQRDCLCHTLPEKRRVFCKLGIYADCHRYTGLRHTHSLLPRGGGQEQILRLAHRQNRPGVSGRPTDAGAGVHGAGPCGLRAGVASAGAVCNAAGRVGGGFCCRSYRTG